MSEGYKREDFKSPLEYNVYRYLKQQARKYKFHIGYETEKLEYVLVKNYVPDFVLTYPDGKKVYIEAKGYLRGEDRAKLLAVKDRHPELDLHLLFSKNNRLNKRARSRYSDWAKRHKIPCAISTVPLEWLGG